MRNLLIPLALLAAAPLGAEDKPEFPAPSQIVGAAPAADWLGIAASDLLVMDLAPEANGKARRVVIQLLPRPFSQGWIGNIRKLATAHWWDGLAVTRVQDNYVAQWGDPDGEDAAKARKLPEGLAVVPESEYTAQTGEIVDFTNGMSEYQGEIVAWHKGDDYADVTAFWKGWPIGSNGLNFPAEWPIHCYGMVGVGRNMSPDTGSGAELYTVIGHAPRHLDRNIALVGRVIEGIEHLSSLPRGAGPLGVYESRGEQVPIRSIRLGSEVADLPAYQYLSTESQSFAKYAEARANRRDAFFIRPAGGADVCNIPVPVRRGPAS
ncbi:peptidylprolyl isomerase [Novosphingobium sp. B 225]|uniref:peptidylprolyl isomerase n=1 Tax=Novosphingobium sp. B 225 TaxID=1961849 RepID=UPI000B4B0CBB|nr:peptidylprolyl isomerase [Novosphingobium sp. B 225]